MSRFSTLSIALSALALPGAAFAQTNIAPAGAAVQSSTAFGGQPGRAIDGNTDPHYHNAHTTTHTDDLADSYWELDFAAKAFRMYEIRLFNRDDCCHGRLSNFRVSVFSGSTELWGQDFYVGSGSVPQGGIEAIPLPANMLGDRVRVQLLGMSNTGEGYLCLSEVQIDGEPVGSAVCGPSVPNSTGASAWVRAVGVDQEGGFALGIIASAMPSNQFGYFLVAQSLGSINPPGSDGTLCLSGDIGRFKKQIQNTQSNGDTFGIVVDTLALPVNPPRPAVAGETWYFQAWFRDGASSNFSDAVAVTFQ